jgi:hypothetical protein
MSSFPHTQAINIVGDEPFDIDSPAEGLDNADDAVLVLDRKPIRKPRTPRSLQKDEDPSMSTVTVSSEPIISAERFPGGFSLPVESYEDEEYYEPVPDGPTKTDRILRKIALYTLAAMSVIFLISLSVSLVIADPMILIPFSVIALAGFSYAKMEWHVRKKFTNRKLRR